LFGIEVEACVWGESNILVFSLRNINADRGKAEEHNDWEDKINSSEVNNEKWRK
jgi:hypothetical protein